MRLIQGLGAAIITPVVVPMGLEIFGKEKLQIVGGAIGGVTALAAAAGPPIGGLIIEYINWQSIFFVNVPFSLISLILIALFVEESYDKTTSNSIDVAGMFFLTATLFLITFALLKGKDYGWHSALILSMFVGSAVAFGLFIFTENKVKAPMVEFSLFRERTFTASGFCYLITGFGLSSPLILFSFFLQDVLEYKPLEAAFVIMSMSLTVVVSMPLGSAIAGKFGAKPINFLGILLLSFSAFLLSRLTFSTSKAAMITDMIVCGFGLGFACQSIISSIKYLPTEKSGIAQGIVNAARQIGTCLGIALVVSLLNANVTDVKMNIKQSADSLINRSGIDSSVKTVMVNDINTSFGDNDSNDDTEQQQILKTKMEDDIRKVVTSIPNSQRPSDEMLSKLYDGVDSIKNGAGRTAQEQKSIANGIGTLSSGLDALSDGNNSLNTGLKALNSGLSQTILGAQNLNSSSRRGLNSLSSGIGQLDSGAQQMLSQFSPGSSGNVTVYDGATGVAGRAQSLSSNLNRYISSVNNTYYLMIKSNPSSPQLLKYYQNSLKQTEAAVASANGTAKNQYKQQAEALANLVTLYSVGTDSTVTTETQFEAELKSLAQQSEAHQNIVAGGSQIAAGAKHLSGKSQKVADQFRDGGTFKNGMDRLADGTSKLKQSTGAFPHLQQGTDKLLQGLLELKSGSDRLLTGSEKLSDGISNVRGGCNKLQSGSRQLTDADIKIKNGAAQIVSGVGLSGQKAESENVMNQIRVNKNNELAGAFDRVFLLAALILIPLSVCGLFTDKKRNRN